MLYCVPLVSLFCFSQVTYVGFGLVPSRRDESPKDPKILFLLLSSITSYVIALFQILFKKKKNQQQPTLKLVTLMNAPFTKLCTKLLLN